MYPQQIIDALRHVRYPGTGKDLIESGMLEDDIRISGFEVSFSLIFQKENDPFIKSVLKAAETALKTYIDPNIAANIHTKFVKVNPTPTTNHQSPIAAKHIIAVHSGKGGVGKSTVTRFPEIFRVEKSTRSARAIACKFAQSEIGLFNVIFAVKTSTTLPSDNQF